MRFIGTLLIVCFSLILIACGGGGGGGGSSEPRQIPTPIPNASATTIVDPALSSGPEVDVVAVQSLTDEQPIGIPISYPVSSTAISLFALNAAGDIVLAARPSNGEANFTASGTVQILAGLVLSTYFAEIDTAALENAVSQTPSFAAAVASFEASLARNVNPSTDPAFQAQLLVLVKESLQVLLVTSPAQTQLQTIVQRMTLPPDRLDPTKTNSRRNAILFETLPPAFGSPLSISLQTDPTKKGIGRFIVWNGTPVFWDVVLTDTSGNQSDNQIMKASSFLLGVFTEGEPLTLVKGAGAFGMKLSPSLEANSAKLVETAVKLLIGARPTEECSRDIAEYVVNNLVEIIKFQEDPTPENILALIIENMKSQWTVIGGSCGKVKTAGIVAQLIDVSDEAAERLVRSLNWVGKALDATEIAVQLQLLIKYRDQPIDVGVCVNDSDFMMSCVSSIAKAYDPPPLAAGLEGNYFLSHGGIKFYDRFGSQTTRPADLKVEYIPENLKDHIEFKVFGYDVNEGMTYSITSLTGSPVEGSILLHDLATDVFSDAIPVKVSKGRIGDGSPISVDVGQTIQLPLLEVGGARPLVFASAYDVYLALTNTAAVEASVSRYNDDLDVNHSILVSIKGKSSGEETNLKIRKYYFVGPHPNFLLAETDVSVNRDLFDGIYTDVSEDEYQGYTHTERGVVTGLSVSLTHTYVNGGGDVSSSFVWEGTITPHDDDFTRGDVKGTGYIVNHNAGTRRPFTLSGSIAVYEDGHAELCWIADPSQQYSPFGGCSRRPGPEY